MPYSIVCNDISRVEADVLVNAANEQLAAGGGVCGALFAAAGREKMRAACDAIGYCPTGGAVGTPGFNLPCRWVVHAVGPVWLGGAHGEERALRSCYQSMFAEAVRLGARSVAFPLISAGIYGYPVRQALSIARQETVAFLADHDEMKVQLVAFDRETVHKGCPFIQDLEAHLVQSSGKPVPDADSNHRGTALCEDSSAPLSGDGFAQAVQQLARERELDELRLAVLSNMSGRRLHTLLSEGTAPEKPCASALTLALHLDFDRASDLLGQAGYVLSDESTFDAVLSFALEREIWDVYRVNEALFCLGQPQLGAW